MGTTTQATKGFAFCEAFFCEKSLFDSQTSYDISCGSTGHVLSWCTNTLLRPLDSYIKSLSLPGSVSKPLGSSHGRGAVCQNSSSLAGSGEQVLSLTSTDSPLWVNDSL